MAFDIPVLLCVFNRPELTARTFAAIAQRKPKMLLVAGDGPRFDHPDDFERVEQIRRIIEQVDWDCNLQAFFQNQNLGCREHMARAITWGFEQAERLIILEDDCLPNASFFPFCEELLERYADTPQVMTICGINHLSTESEADYLFSKYPLIWGWASWRRAWKHFDLDMSDWRVGSIQQRVLDQFTGSDEERAYWRDIFSAQANNSINTWDYSWTYASWKMGGLTVVPKTNLVSNIGFGQSATHTVDSQSKLANQPTQALAIKHHPSQIVRDHRWDRVAQEFYFPIPTGESVTVQCHQQKSWIQKAMRSWQRKRAA
jgi:hypothetical protein